MNWRCFPFRHRDVKVCEEVSWFIGEVIERHECSVCGRVKLKLRRVTAPEWSRMREEAEKKPYTFNDVACLSCGKAHIAVHPTPVHYPILCPYCGKWACFIRGTIPPLPFLKGNNP